VAHTRTFCRETDSGLSILDWRVESSRTSCLTGIAHIILQTCLGGSIVPLWHVEVRASRGISKSPFGIVKTLGRSRNVRHDPKFRGDDVLREQLLKRLHCNGRHGMIFPCAQCLAEAATI